VSIRASLLMRRIDDCFVLVIGAASWLLITVANLLNCDFILNVSISAVYCSIFRPTSKVLILRKLLFVV